jgi:hypothetical protein
MTPFPGSSHSQIRYQKWVWLLMQLLVVSEAAY